MMQNLWEQSLNEIGSLNNLSAGNTPLGRWLPFKYAAWQIADVALVQDETSRLLAEGLCENDDPDKKT